VIAAGKSLRRPAFCGCAALAGLALALAAGDLRGGEKPKAAPAAAEPAAKPITTSKGQLGDLMRKWFADGTAAGNDGDWYDNRDRGHSGLDLGPYPQLRKIEYTEDERKQGRDWALQRSVLPQVVFGNSSTSSGVTSGGSNPRMAYSHPMGLAMLCAQYTSHNLYIYPEHQDCDPGRNGSPGYGDVYPTNTPYLIISQGSSGSDRAFMRAIPYVLAAFRPDVKRRLVETGLLMPTIQMILRRTNPQVATKKDYLTGKAHPTVFDGGWVNDLKMAEMAHEIRADAIPPMIQLRVVEEDAAVNGRDFFDLHTSEHLGDTPIVIARIFRATARTRRMVVSAEASGDLNKRPLTFHWVVLRGDASRIRLRPTNEAGSICEIVTAWHERRPVAQGSALESNRVDIGVFVDNGVYYSAPGFITFFCLDDEARDYDGEGRVIEVGYGLGTMDVSVSNWSALAGLLDARNDSPAAGLLRKTFTAPEIAAILGMAAEHKTAQASYDAAQARSKEAQALRQKAADAKKAAEKRRDEAKEAAQKAATAETQAALQEAEAASAAAAEADKKAEAEAADVRKVADAASKAVADILARKREGTKAPVKELVQGALAAVAANPNFYPESAAAIAAAVGGDAGRKGVLDAARKRLVAMGLLKDGPEGAFDLTPIQGGAGPAASRLTRFERALLEQFNGQILGQLVCGGAVNFSYKRNYVDPRVAVPKAWRDVYRYSPMGECIGWTRRDGAAVTEFNASGLAVLDKDALGRCLKAQAVRYEMDSAGADPRRLQPGPLKMVREAGVTEYEYANDDDWRGRAKTPPAGK
jgi:hypothetical protein